MMDCRKFARSIALRFIVPVVTVAILVMLCNVGFAQTLIPSSNSQAVVGTRLVPGMLNERGEEVVKRGTGFSAVLTLQDDSLRTLIQTGRVEIEIPTQLINNVDSVIIKRPFYFKEKRASDFADTELAGQKLFLNIDDAVVERIDYQPVELKVYESNFTPADKLSADKNSMAMYDLDEKFGRLIIDQSGREFARLKVDMKTVRESEELTATPKPAE